MQITIRQKTRCVISHVESALNGLFYGCLLMSCGQNTSIDTDYRTELRFSVFFDWIEENIF